MVGIIDKNPRKPKKEGPKAQERYVEEIATEWIDNHASKDVFKDTPDEVPMAVRLRYAEAERVTQAIMVDKGMLADPKDPKPSNVLWTPNG